MKVQSYNDSISKIEAKYNECLDVNLPVSDRKFKVRQIVEMIVRKISCDQNPQNLWNGYWIHLKMLIEDDVIPKSHYSSFQFLYTEGCRAAHTDIHLDVYLNPMLTCLEVIMDWYIMYEAANILYKHQDKIDNFTEEFDKLTNENSDNKQILIKTKEFSEFYSDNLLPVLNYCSKYGKGKKIYSIYNVVEIANKLISTLDTKS